VIFGIVDTPANSTLDQLTPFTREVNRTVMSIPESDFTFQITFPNGGFWAWASRRGRSGGGPRSRSSPRSRRGSPPSPGPDLPDPSSGAPRRRVVPGGGRHRLDRGELEILGFAQKLQEKATASGMFAFRRSSTSRSTSPPRRSSSTARRWRSWPRSPDGGRRHRVGGRRQLRQPLQHRRRSYKVIPQLQRSERLNPEQLADLHVTGPDAAWSRSPPSRGCATPSRRAR